MKKYLLSLATLALGIMGAYAQTISVADATIKAGETKVVSINLENTQTNIVSFQMDLTLPDGVTLNKAGCELSSRFADGNQELSIGRQQDGSYRLASTSFALTPITGTSGELVKLSLTAANDAKGGTASIKNIRLATSDSQKLTPSNASFQVSVPYTLTYKVDGNEYKTSSIVYGTAITPEAAPTREGHTFSGWSEIPATMPNHDVVVTGSFTINSYTLTYKVDGEVYKTSTVVYGSAITPEAAPTKEGYTFSGWSEIPATMPANDVVVTGTFTVNNYTLTYKVDGADYKTLTVAYGTTITPEAAPTKEGYTFSGWSEIPATMPANDVTVTGSFSINSYTLTYKVDGEVYKTSTVVYGTAITPEAAPTKEGYTFSGWSEIPATMPANDVVVTGSFTINSYTLTYKVDGEVYKTSTIVYGTAITPEAAPTKEGYTFSGWSEIPATMPANDVVVTGTFTMNPATVTAKSYIIEYGDAIPTFEYESEGPLFGIPALTCSAMVGSPVGTYQIQVAKGTVGNNNVTYNAGTLTITPAPLSITANSYVINQGEMLPILEATYEGFKNGETAEVLTKQPILSCDASSDSEEGTYEIIVSGAEAENYTISYTNGTLTITNEETDISQLDNAIYIESFSARIGDNVQMEICLKNAEAATAYVFDLVLPEGISVAKNDKGKYLDELSDRHDDHTRTFNYKGENTYALSALSGNSEELTGNDGAIRLLTLYVDESVAEGVYPIKIRNASYSKPDGSLVTMPSTISLVTVEDYLIGDVNGNGGVDIGDAVSIVNYLVGKESSSFVEKAADTNHNGQIDIGDAVTIVNFLVGKTSSLSPQSVKAWDENESQ